MSFLSKEHEERYNDLVSRADIRGDIEREVAMYIIAGGTGLYEKANRLYDFKSNEFIFDIEEDENGEIEIVWKASLSSSQEKLMRLAFSLFSSRDRVGVVELFRVLDSNNKRLALNAISMMY